jgi:hypothetical protein
MRERGGEKTPDGKQPIVRALAITAAVVIEPEPRCSRPGHYAPFFLSLRPRQVPLFLTTTAGVTVLFVFHFLPLLLLTLLSLTARVTALGSDYPFVYHWGIVEIKISG